MILEINDWHAPGYAKGFQMDYHSAHGRIPLMNTDLPSRHPAPRFLGAAKSPKEPLPNFQCRGVSLVPFPLIPDERGTLVFAEFPKHLPFVPKRFFATYGVPQGSVRGEHAHRELSQMIIALQGSLMVTVDDGAVSEACILESPGVGLCIPPLVWGIQSRHSADCVMLVLASNVYDESGYIRDYDEFLSQAQLPDAMPHA